MNNKKYYFLDNKGYAIKSIKEFAHAEYKRDLLVDPPACTLCGEIGFMFLSAIEKFRIDGSKVGDLILGGNSSSHLYSERFINIWDKSALKGLRINRNPLELKCKKTILNNAPSKYYFLCTPEHNLIRPNANTLVVNEESSEPTCEKCGVHWGPTLEIDNLSYDTDFDIFLQYAIAVGIVISENFVDLIIKHKFTNMGYSNSFVYGKEGRIRRKYHYINSKGELRIIERYVPTFPEK